MSPETVFTNARIVTASEVFHGSLQVVDGRIAAVDPGSSSLPGALDLEGDFLLPGLIELHTDNLERHFQPRPGVLWPAPLAALAAHDVQIAGAGITTVFDAVAVGEYTSGSQRRKMLDISIAALDRARAEDQLRADHLLHLRCEVSDHAVVEMFEAYETHPLVGLVSVMDHTPGQRQWRDLEKYRLFHRDKKWSEADLHNEVARKQEAMRTYSARHRREIVERCRVRGLVLASHDDTTEEHVAEAAADGITIAEFPTTRVAAERARAEGMTTVMGSPNLVRGGSHSGNIAATELADAGLLDALSSDYVPTSLLHGAFMLHHDNGLTLPEALATVSANPAEMLGLHDRGRIAPGLRADLLRVHETAEVPLVRETYCRGRRRA